MSLPSNQLVTQDQPVNAQQLEHWPIERLIDYARNPRKNDHAVDTVAAAIHEFGFRVPVIAKSDGTVVDGHLRLKAARKLGLETVPVFPAASVTDRVIVLEPSFRSAVSSVVCSTPFTVQVTAIGLWLVRKPSAGEVMTTTGAIAPRK